MATKKELEEKKEYARLLFMQGETQKVIAEKVGVSAVTINKWVAENGWQEQRAASNITRPELLDKKASIVDVIEVFMAFSKWMQFRMSFDDGITPELLKTINKYHNLYISELLQNKFNQ